MSIFVYFVRLWDMKRKGVVVDKRRLALSLLPYQTSSCRRKLYNDMVSKC